MKLPHVIITSDDIWDPTVLDHLIDIENDTYHPATDPTIVEEAFISFDEHISVARTYLHHDSYGPDYICDVYNNEYMQTLAFNFCRILRLTTLNSLLQYVNWLVWEICSVN